MSKPCLNLRLVISTWVAVLVFTSTLSGQERKLNLQKYFTALFDNGQFNGGVLVAENGRIIYQQSFGYANFENKTPNTNTTSFALASVSKTITATAVLQLSEAGRLHINYPVKKYLDWFPYPAITIRHLLSHTSGLPPYNAYFDSLRKQQPARIFTNADFREGIVSNPRPLLYTPGENGNYDNINFIVLALLIEKVSGLSYPDYIAKHILQPAGMKHTLLVPLREQYRDDNNMIFARAYLFPHRYSERMVRATRVPYIVSYWSAYNFSGFADYVSTPADLLAYDHAYYSDKLLSAATRDEAFTPVKLNNGIANPAGFGLGWEVSEDTSLGKVVYHNGNATGSNCTLLRNISRRQTIIVFDNIHSNNAESIAFRALGVLNGVIKPVAQKSLAHIYAKLLLMQGAKTARDSILKLKKDTVHYQINEDEMNLLGYDFMGGINNPNPFHFPEEQKYKEALETFKFNTELFPASWNVYDSYGEILLQLGHREEAISMYKKSIELNPKNDNGKKVIEELSKSK